MSKIIRMWHSAARRHQYVLAKCKACKNTFYCFKGSDCYKRGMCSGCLYRAEKSE